MSSKEFSAFAEIKSLPEAERLAESKEVSKEAKRSTEELDCPVHCSNVTSTVLTRSIRAALVRSQDSRV